MSSLQPTAIDVLFTPADFAALEARDLTRTVCVVFDVLRATTSMVTALANGAVAIRPVGGIGEALAVRAEHPGAVLAGERGGLRIGADLAGGVAFDLGNSPREFTRERVEGRTLVMTTTNGTRALRACAGAGRVLVGALVNLGAVAASLTRARPREILLVCSGTYEEAAFEDVLAAGALCERIEPMLAGASVSDSVLMARHAHRPYADNLLEGCRLARNGRRLWEHAELHGDVAECAALDRHAFVPELGGDGWVRRGVD
ncbi:MAG TPA: 2-phosphosulfolactate phosphatase [Verrucomicrobiota bacterium]|nr:2-phosphosulfolactate phosphatase [Verrucomicrobiota bacterium]HNU49942.1 2-phosphosulfolactate phosphatase [Verrucomicrobiota bacterium]